MEVFAECTRTCSALPVRNYLKGAWDKSSLSTVADISKCCDFLREFETSDVLETATPKTIANICDEAQLALQAVSSELLVDICDQAIKIITEDLMLESGRILELLPKLLSVASVGNSSDVDRRCIEITSELCSVDWPENHISHAASMFLDIHLAEEQFKTVVQKLVKKIETLGPDEIPPLTYQLLLLANKGRKATVVKGIIDSLSSIERDALHNSHHNNDMDESETCSFVEPAGPKSTITMDVLRPILGTVIHHMSSASKQDQGLGREIIKYLKSGIEISPFATALGLSLSRIHRFEDSIFGLLKGQVVNFFKENDRRAASSWLLENTEPGTDFGETLKVTVQNSADWDQVAHGLVILSMSLVDGGRSDGKEHSPANMCANVGCELLRQLFEVHPRLRPEILDMMLARITTKSGAATELFTKFLADIVQDGMHMMMENISKIKGFFDHISFISPNTAIGVLRATMPLVVVSPSLRDTLMLVLRKSMFSRDLNARLIAIKGFLLFLRELKMKDQSNQASQMSHAVKTHEALGMEIFGMLKRCTTQQAEVRSSFYSGLVSLVDRRPGFQDIAMEMVFNNARQFIDLSENALRPLSLSTCVPYSEGNKVVIVEPLGEMLACIVALTRSTKNDETMEWLKKLTQKLIKTDLEDFELDKSSEFSVEEGSRGLANLRRAEVLLSIYQALVDFTYCIADGSIGTLTDNSMKYHMEQCTLILSLSKKAAILEETIKVKIDKKTKLNVVTVFNFSTFIRAVETLCCDQTPEYQSRLALLRNNTQFCKYLLKLGIDLLTGSTLCVKFNDIKQQIISVGKVAMHEYAASSKGTLLQKAVEESGGSTSAKKEKRDFSKSIKMLCLDMLNNIVVLVKKQLGDTMTSLLDECVFKSERQVKNAGDVTTSTQRAVTFVGWLQREIELSINEEQNREASALVSILGVTIDSSSEQILATFKSWLQQLCIQKFIKDSTLAKGLLSMLLSTGDKNVFELARAVAQNVKIHLGNVAHAPDDNNVREYLMVSHDHSESWLPGLLISTLGSNIEELEWYAAWIQPRLSPTEPESGTDALAKMARRLHSVLEFSIELVQTEQGSSIFDLFKHLRRVYNICCNIVKYQLQLFGSRGKGSKDLALTQEIRALFEYTGVYSQDVYGLITFYMEGGTNTDDKKDKKKSKSNVQQHSKVIPNLVYAMEQYERYLIQLNEKPDHTFHLLTNFKRSIVRDFRIKHGAVKEALEEKENAVSCSEISGKGKGKRSFASTPMEDNTDTKKRKG